MGRSLRHYVPLLKDTTQRVWLLPDMIYADVAALFSAQSRAERDRVICECRRRWKEADEEDAPRDAT